MQGLDTNVLVRMIVDDDPVQCAAAADLAASLTATNPGYVNLITTAEFIWVLDKTYKFPSATIIATLRQLINTATLVFEGKSDIESALHDADTTGAGLADALIQRRNTRASCTTTHTFDHKTARLAGMSLLPAP